MKAINIGLGALAVMAITLASSASAQVSRYITGTIGEGLYARVIPPIEGKFVIVSAPRSQWVVQPRCSGTPTAEHCHGWTDRIQCEMDRNDFAMTALSLGGPAGQLLSKQYEHGRCETSDGSAAFKWKENNPDYGLVR
jgi:hypothetical protein